MEFQKLQRIIADVLNISEDKITKESAFVDDLKADSLDVFQIITEIEDSSVFRFQTMQLRILLL